MIENGISAAIRSIPKILSANFSQRDEIIKAMSKPRLLVLDDFRAERKSSFSTEIIYTVIDERYKSGKPLILTTNLSLKDIKNPQNMEYNRIYSRVIEMCLPVFFPYIGNREEKASKKMAMLRDIFKNEGD